MRYLLLIPPLISGAISYSVPVTSTRVAPPLAHRSLSHEPMRSCEGGAEYPIELEMQAARISSTTGVRGESLDMALYVTHRLGAGARIVRAFEVLDDRGNQVVPVVASSPEALPAATRTGFNVKLPVLATDGFYVVRATVAAKDAAGASDERVAETYWEVVGGKLMQHDSADWLARSNASTAVKL